MKRIKQKKSIGITLGDPSGIGPEIVAKALKKTSINQLAHFKIIGESCLFEKYFNARYSNCSFIDSSDILTKTKVEKYKPGKPTVFGAKASINYLSKAIELVKIKEIDGIVTAPICKETIGQFDPSFQGHTEFLQKAFNKRDIGMMFASDKMRVTLVTRHIPLIKVSHEVTAQNVYTAIELTYHALTKFFKIKKPTLAVCGLNPHAGEGGMMGDEEIKTIIPAIKRANLKKIDARGPFAADTLFSPDISNNYDAVIAMYHDQGLIPIKTLCFSDLVNLTLGLPFVRTSPAHGTAFNIAGKNIAKADSICAAIRLATELI